MICVCVTEVFHVNKVCEWPFLQQMKLCFNALKMCDDVSMNKTDSSLSPPPKHSPPPPPPHTHTHTHTHILIPPPFFLNKKCIFLMIYSWLFPECWTIDIIPPHWHDTGSWNSSSHKTRNYLFYIVNIMGADVLATQGARASATMILTMLNQINLVPARQRLTNYVLSWDVMILSLNAAG